LSVSQIGPKFLSQKLGSVIWQKSCSRLVRKKTASQIGKLICDDEMKKKVVAARTYVDTIMIRISISFFFTIQDTDDKKKQTTFCCIEVKLNRRK
jgi:hypothetical protein